MYKINDVINFKYNGEDREGLVLSVDYNYTTVLDFEQSVQRKFLSSDMGCVNINSDIKIIDIRSLPHDMDRSIMYAAFEKEGREIHIVDDKIIAVKPINLQIKYVYNGNQSLVGIISIYNNGNIKVDNRVSKKIGYGISDLLDLITCL